MRINQDRILKHICRIVIVSVIFLLVSGMNLSNSQPRSVSAEAVNTCLNRVNIPIADIHWVYVPESPDELYTNEEYFFLAGQLIINKVVDASDCPAGGLMLNGYANACGMSRAMETVVAVQNLLNEPILQAYESIGVCRQCCSSG